LWRGVGGWCNRKISIVQFLTGSFSLSHGVTASRHSSQFGFKCTASAYRKPQMFEQGRTTQASSRYVQVWLLRLRHRVGQAVDFVMSTRFGFNQIYWSTRLIASTPWNNRKAVLRPTTRQQSQHPAQRHQMYHVNKQVGVLANII
jgi:hypothetical protein